MYRSEVFAAIDLERTYQDRCHPGHRHEVGTYLTYLRHYLNLAGTAVMTGSDDRDGLAEIRKIAALAVACLEQHGCPGR